eukprot:524378-Hanusia_phi.AAC.11
MLLSAQIEVFSLSDQPLVCSSFQLTSPYNASEGIVSAAPDLPVAICTKSHQIKQERLEGSCLIQLFARALLGMDTEAEILALLAMSIRDSHQVDKHQLVRA